MPNVLKSLCLIHFEVQGEISVSSARESAEPRDAAPITVRVRVGIVAEIPYLEIAALATRPLLVFLARQF